MTILTRRRSQKERRRGRLRERAAPSGTLVLALVVAAAVTGALTVGGCGGSASPNGAGAATSASVGATGSGGSAVTFTGCGVACDDDDPCTGANVICLPKLSGGSECKPNTCNCPTGQFCLFTTTGCMPTGCLGPCASCASGTYCDYDPSGNEKGCFDTATGCLTSQTKCGTVCCDSDQECLTAGGVSGCAPPGSTPCGVGKYCGADESCNSNGTGCCAAGTTACGTGCCGSGTTCVNGSECVLPNGCPSGFPVSCGGDLCCPSEFPVCHGSCGDACCAQGSGTGTGTGTGTGSGSNCNDCSAVCCEDSINCCDNQPCMDCTTTCNDCSGQCCDDVSDCCNDAPCDSSACDSCTDCGGECCDESADCCEGTCDDTCQ